MDIKETQSVASPAQLANIQKRLQLDNQVRGGVGWFFWIAGLSLINSAAYLLGKNFVFFLGLGITQLIDGFMSIFANELGSSGNILRFIGFAIDVLIASIFVAFGVLGRKQYKLPVIIGMILYSIDAVIMLIFQDYLSVGLHVFALFGIWIGLKSMSDLAALEKDGNDEPIQSIRKRMPISQIQVRPQRTIQERAKGWLLLGVVLLGIIFLFALESILH